MENQKRFIYDDSLKSYKKYCHKCNKYHIESDFYSGDSWCKYCRSSIKRVQTKLKKAKNAEYIERVENKNRIKNTILALKAKK